ncbi:BF3164 family lipoprotein [Tamlana crocina]|uniref:BF3164 family lipoprotein n=1 Tax=Tamlana crocina TaxID=393006 RepID=UPI003CC916AE
MDSTLIIGSYTSSQKKYLQNYSLSTNKFSNPYLSKGRGPSEIIYMANISLYDNYLGINDARGKKIVILDKNNAILGNSESELITYSFKKNQFYFAILTDDLQCITTGNGTSKFKIQIIDLQTGEIIRDLGKLKSNPNDMPTHIIAQAGLTYPLLKPTRDKLALAYYHTDIIEIFDLNTEKSTSLQGPETFNSDFRIYNNNWLPNDKTKFAFVSGTKTNKYIYLLYSGKNANDKKWNQGNYIFVFDWNLNPIKKIILDKEVSQISISEDDKTLYSFDEYTGYIIQTTINY